MKELEGFIERISGEILGKIPEGNLEIINAGIMEKKSEGIHSHTKMQEKPRKESLIESRKEYLKEYQKEYWQKHLK